MPLLGNLEWYFNSGSTTKLFYSAWNRIRLGLQIWRLWINIHLLKYWYNFLTLRLTRGKLGAPSSLSKLDIHYKTVYVEIFFMFYKNKHYLVTLNVSYVVIILILCKKYFGNMAKWNYNMQLIEIKQAL